MVHGCLKPPNGWCQLHHTSVDVPHCSRIADAGGRARRIENRADSWSHRSSNSQPALRHGAKIGQDAPADDCWEANGTGITRPDAAGVTNKMEPPQSFREGTIRDRR